MAIMAAGRAAIAACHAWFRAAAALHARALSLKLIRDHRCYYYNTSSGGSSSPSSAASCPPVLAALICAAIAAAAFFPRAVAFFLPLVASTSAFCATAYLSVAWDPERGAAKEVVLVRRGEEGDEPAEAGTLQVYADANASAYAHCSDKSSMSSSCTGFPVGCFLRKSAKRGVDEDGEEVVFAGRLLVPDGTSALEDELVSLQVDRMAARVWDSYFGRWSTWNHYEGDGDDGCDA